MGVMTIASPMRAIFGNQILGCLVFAACVGAFSLSAESADAGCEVGRPGETVGVLVEEVLESVGIPGRGQDEAIAELDCGVERVLYWWRTAFWANQSGEVHQALSLLGGMVDRDRADLARTRLEDIRKALPGDLDSARDLPLAFAFIGRFEARWGDRDRAREDFLVAERTADALPVEDEDYTPRFSTILSLAQIAGEGGLTDTSRRLLIKADGIRRVHHPEDMELAKALEAVRAYLEGLASRD